jgi:Uma2 family endonuclease
MTADSFLAWSASQPKGRGYELSDGMVVELAAERARHGEVKGQIFQRLKNAIDAGLLPCQVFVGSMPVAIDERTIYEPDVLLRYGPRIAPETLAIVDPLLVCEVLSPSSRTRDVGEKLAGYFRIPSLRHYLVVDPDRQTVIHHGRQDDGTILTRILADQPVRLDPPGIAIAELFPPGF